MTSEVEMASEMMETDQSAIDGEGSCIRRRKFVEKAQDTLEQGEFKKNISVFPSIFFLFLKTIDYHYY